MISLVKRVLRLLFPTNIDALDVLLVKLDALEERIARLESRRRK